MPARSVDRYFRELQHLALDGRHNRPFKVETLERYRWVQERRDQAEESWRESMLAWNRVSGEKYDNWRIFRNHFKRTEDSLEALRKRVAALEKELSPDPK